jgi:hypothetical protein
MLRLRGALRSHPALVRRVMTTTSAAPGAELASAHTDSTTATTSSVGDTSSTLPDGLRKHLIKWGKALTDANSADALGRTFSMVGDAPTIDSPPEAACLAHSTACVTEAHEQLSAVCAEWMPDSQLHLCGSSVTQGSLTAQSDLDFICVPTGRANSNGVNADRQKQLTAVENLHRHLHKHLPNYMRRGFVAMKTARTPVAKFAFNHEPPTKVRITQQINTDASELKPAPLINAAAGATASSIMLEVPHSVRRSRFVVPSDAELEAARTVLLHFKGITDGITAEAILVALAAAAGKTPIKADVLSVEHNVSNYFHHPLGFDAPTSAAEDHSLSLQAEAAASEKRRESTLVTVRGATAIDALRIIAAFPDGKLVAKTKRDLVTADFADRRSVPALLRFQWDVSFAGYSAVNSYLIRHYLRGPASPAWVQHGSLVLKRWARRTHVANAQLGFLTPYAITIMWCYYLLVTRQLQWLDPAAIPVPSQLPLLPPPALNSPGNAQLQLSDQDHEALTYNLVNFFRFFTGLTTPSTALKTLEALQASGTKPAGFRSDCEVVSLSRPRRSVRDDIGWDHRLSMKGGDMPGFLMCIEDPYELIGEGGLNLGRHLTQRKLDFINEKVSRALKTILLSEPATDVLTPSPSDNGLLGTSADPSPEGDDFE